MNCDRTRFSLAEILVLVGGTNRTIPPAPAVPSSTRIAARLECVQGHSSRLTIVVVTVTVLVCVGAYTTARMCTVWRCTSMSSYEHDYDHTHIIVVRELTALLFVRTALRNNRHLRGVHL